MSMNIHRSSSLSRYAKRARNDIEVGCMVSMNVGQPPIAQNPPFLPYLSGLRTIPPWTNPLLVKKLNLTETQSKLTLTQSGDVGPNPKLHMIQGVLTGRAWFRPNTGEYRRASERLPSKKTDGPLCTLSFEMTGR